MSEPVVATAGHSRESSLSLTSSDSSNGNGPTGLVLSVSALSRRGGAKDSLSQNSPRSEESNESLSSEFSYQSNTMGGAASNTEEADADLEGLVRLEPEGINETDSQNFTSFLSVDKRLFGRLQEELNQAQSELKLKEEQVIKLSRIRDDVEREMEELVGKVESAGPKVLTLRTQVSLKIMVVNGMVGGDEGFLIAKSSQ